MRVRAASIVAMLCALPVCAFAEAPPSFISEWGSHGSGPGQFDKPCGIAVGPDGSVYISESQNRRVQKFTADGQFVMAFGTEHEPYGICVGPDGSIYVTDGVYNRIRKYSEDGTHLLDFQGPLLMYPGAGVALDDQGRVYCTDWPDNHILVFDPAGPLLSVWGPAIPNMPFGLFDPRGIAVSPSGTIYLIDDLFRVTRLSLNGTWIGEWDTRGLADAMGVAVDPEGNVFLTSCQPYHPNHAFKFTATGMLLSAWAPSGLGPGELVGGRSIAVSSAGDVYVVDPNNDRVVRFGYAPTATAAPTWGSLKATYRW